MAVFTDTGRTSDTRELTNWLNNSGTDKTYWIGLVRPWWQTTDKDGRSIDLQYSRWQMAHPTTVDSCVTLNNSNNANYWITTDCNRQEGYICQNYTDRTARTVPATAKTTIPTTARTIPTTMAVTSTAAIDTTTDHQSSKGPVSPTSTNEYITTASSTSYQSVQTIQRENGKYLGIGIAIGAGAFGVIVCVIAVLVCCYRNRCRRRIESRRPEMTPSIRLSEIQRRDSEPPPVPALRHGNYSNGHLHASMNDGHSMSADIFDTDHYSTIDDNWSSNSDTIPKMYDNDRYRSASEMSIPP